jgi:hypothetical protein
MPARKVAKKTAKKGGTIEADLTSIAVPFGLLLAKQSLEKLSGTKVKATKGKKVAKAKTVKRVKRVAVGGSNANVSGVNTMAHKTGANVGGKSVKKGRGRPRSRVGGNANAANASANVPSGVNTMAHKTGANVGGKGKAKKSTKSKKSGGTPKDVPPPSKVVPPKRKTTQTQTPSKVVPPPNQTKSQNNDQDQVITKRLRKNAKPPVPYGSNPKALHWDRMGVENTLDPNTKKLLEPDVPINSAVRVQNKKYNNNPAYTFQGYLPISNNPGSRFAEPYINPNSNPNPNNSNNNGAKAGGKSKAKRGRGRPRKN